MSKAKRSELPEEYKEIWDELIMPVDTDIDFNKVILSSENKKKYQEVIKEQKYRDKLFEYGLEPQNRMILFGASGVGKTYSIKALSNLLDYTMIYVDIAKALSEGNVSVNLRNLFNLGNYIAERYNGAILFLDECDSVAWNRDQTATGDSGVIRRATNSIFQGMDQMSKKIIFVAATNMLHRLDNAFERRFNVKMKFTRPQEDLDDTIKHFMFPKFILEDNVDDTVREIIKKKVLQNNKMSYYEIEEVVKKAMKRSVLNDTAVVKTEDIYNDLAVNMGVNFRFIEGRKKAESNYKSKTI